MTEIEFQDLNKQKIALEERCNKYRSLVDYIKSLKYMMRLLNKYDDYKSLYLEFDNKAQYSFSHVPFKDIKELLLKYMSQQLIEKVHELNEL